MDKDRNKAPLGPKIWVRLGIFRRCARDPVAGDGIWACRDGSTMTGHLIAARSGPKHDQRNE